MSTAGASAAVRWVDARLVAPQADRGERFVCYASALLGAAFAFAVVRAAGLPLAAQLVVAAVAFDLFGGAVVNATRAAKRWFHRPGRTAGHHFAFVAVHVQPFLLALAVPGFGWLAAAVGYGLAVAGAAAVLCAPPPLRRPVAFAVTVLAAAGVLALVPVPPELAWVIPVLLIKLLLAHLLAEGERP